MAEFKAKMIVVAAPSGAGKSSFVKRIIGEIPMLMDTITYTTRKMRANESEGHPYYFVSTEEFQKLIDEDFFVEWAEVHGNQYGTPRHQIDEIFERGQAVIMDVDIQGVRTFKKKFPNSVSIFIVPPSIAELEKRIILREGGRSPEDLKLRMENAKMELDQANSFDYQIVNDDFEPSFQRFKKLVVEILGIQ